jgi:hypothetical protein
LDGVANLPERCDKETVIHSKGHIVTYGATIIEEPCVPELFRAEMVYHTGIEGIV